MPGWLLIPLGVQRGSYPRRIELRELHRTYRDVTFPQTRRPIPPRHSLVELSASTCGSVVLGPKIAYDDNAVLAYAAIVSWSHNTFHACAFLLDNVFAATETFRISFLWRNSTTPGQQFRSNQWNLLLSPFLVELFSLFLRSDSIRTLPYEISLCAELLFLQF